MFEYNAKVTHVVDGDTIDLSIDLGFDIWYNSRVRFVGIDTPESRTRDLEEKKRGLAAKDRVLELCPVGGDVVLRTSKDGKGKFGRILGEIFVPGVVQSLNQLLIEEGHAVEYFGGKKPIKKKIDLDHIPQGPL
tara:strand:- start:24 stop:425 length:402 start_codon:yes stop_codon:yes gene_type:complete